MNKRQYNLDLLRIVCCFLVVFMHSTSFVWNTAPINSLGWYSAMILDYIGFIAVPIFYMLSGYFLLNLNKNITYSYILKKLYKLLCAFFFWSIVYIIWKYRLYLGNIVITQEIIDLYLKELFQGQPHFWFLFNLIGMYLLVPIFRNIIKDKALLKYFIILFFIIYFILYPLSLYIPIISLLYNFVNAFGFTKFFGFCVFFILGGIIKSFDFRRINKLYLLGIFSMLIMIISNIIYSYVTKSKGEFLCEYLQPFVFVSSVATFVFFLNLKIENSKAKAIITRLSKTTMGIYFIHMIIFYTLTGAGLYYINLPAYIIIIISAVLNYIISTGIIMIISKIPIISEYII